jgi:hypothetical protein
MLPPHLYNKQIKSTMKNAYSITGNHSHPFIIKCGSFQEDSQKQQRTIMEMKYIFETPDTKNLASGLGAVDVTEGLVGLLEISFAQTLESTATRCTGTRQNRACP